MNTSATEATLKQLMSGLMVVNGRYNDIETYRSLGHAVGKMSAEHGANDSYTFCLTIPLELFPTVLGGIGTVGLCAEDDGWRRAIIERSFGHGLEPARELDDMVTGIFHQDAIFHIDHYLGKEMVQNLVALYFVNELYEPLWNSAHVDHVRTMMAEDVGIGTRVGHYDGVGATRDVVQNHLLQLLTLTAIKEPISFRPPTLRIEKEKVPEATGFHDSVGGSAVIGQYTSGRQGDEWVREYKKGPGIPADSITDIYAALCLRVGTRRWKSVPFYLRVGKCLERRVSEIAVIFKHPPFLPFPSTDGLGHNALVIRIQPNEGMAFKLGSKVLRSSMQLHDVAMDFAYGHAFTEYALETYKRLILNVLLGDPPSFPRHCEIELPWRLPDQAESHWAEDPESIAEHVPGTWGPAAPDRILVHDGRARRLLQEGTDMIIHMNGTNTTRMDLRLDELHETAGSGILGRVLALIIIAKNVGGARGATASVADTARTYPCRIIAILSVNGEESKVDAELRAGPEAGLSEIVTLRRSNDSANNLEMLIIPSLFPGAPVVVWWVQDAPRNPPHMPIGAVAQRHITTTQNSGVPANEILRQTRDDYAPGDTGLVWTGMTFWRSHLAATLDEPPHEVVERAVVHGNHTHPAVAFLAVRLTLRPEVPVEVEHTRGTATDGVSTFRSSGELRLNHPVGSDFGDMVCPNHKVQRVNLTIRTMGSKMIKELREITSDIAYEEVLRHGLERALPSGE